MKLISIVDYNSNTYHHYVNNGVFLDGRNKTLKAHGGRVRVTPKEHHVKQCTKKVQVSSYRAKATIPKSFSELKPPKAFQTIIKPTKERKTKPTTSHTKLDRWAVKI